MNNRQNDEMEIDLAELFFVLLHRLPVLLAATVAGVVIAGIISFCLLTPMYTSTAKIYILTNQSTMVSLSDIQVGSSLAGDYEELIKSRPVVEEVAKNLELTENYEQLLDCIDTINTDNTRIIQITATYPDPVIAKNIANEFVKVSTKQISEIMHIDEPTVAEEAIAADHQSSPNNMKNLAVGGILGLLLAAAVIVMRYILDDTIRTQDDVERYLSMNTLAMIPLEGGTDNHEKKSERKFRGIRKG